MVTIIAAILVFGIVIAVHEFGHFAMAKWSGIQVNEFSIGMGPTLWKKIYKGTQYSVRAFPIGGFVAMEGEESPESQQAQRGEAASANEAAPQSTAAPYTPASYDEIPTEPEAPSGYVSPIPLEERTGVSFDDVPVYKRCITVAAGAVMNFVLGFVVLFILVNMQDSITSRVIYGFEENALCEQTGLQVNDEIIAVNGRTCFVANDIVYELSRTENASADFTVLRDGEEVLLENVQFDTGTNEDGSSYMQMNFIVYGLEKTPLNVLEEAVRYELYYSRLILSSLVDLVTGRESINNLSGPVGIVSAIGTAASYGLEDLLSLLALITVNLGVFNLLPLPALDGGKLVFLVFEGITGKPVPSKIQGMVNMIGLFLLLALMLFVTYNDMLRLIAGELF